VVFVGLEKLVTGDGKAVYNAARHRMKKDGVSLAQVLGFGSDGAAVMLGLTDTE
jgi:hypothetical protein